MIEVIEFNGPLPNSKRSIGRSVGQAPGVLGGRCEVGLTVGRLAHVPARRGELEAENPWASTGAAGRIGA